jgi:hypothetical protein
MRARDVVAPVLGVRVGQQVVLERGEDVLQRRDLDVRARRRRRRPTRVHEVHVARRLVAEPHEVVEQAPRRRLLEEDLAVPEARAAQQPLGLGVELLGAQTGAVGRDPEEVEVVDAEELGQQMRPAPRRADAATDGRVQRALEVEGAAQARVSRRRRRRRGRRA